MSETQLIDERDAAEAALSDAYRVVCGREPEWSNNFHYREAIEDMRDACGTRHSGNPDAQAGLSGLSLKDSLLRIEGAVSLLVISVPASVRESNKALFNELAANLAALRASTLLS